MKQRINEFVGSRIREIRKNRGLTQKELGEKIGVKHNTISSYEKGTNEPEQEMLFKMADVLDVSINDFFPYKKVVEISSKSLDYFPASIGAGLPLEVDGITEASKISVSDEVLGKYKNDRDLFVARASGDSMNNIFDDGSLIIIKPLPLESIKNGDIVVYSIDGEYSVKHFYKYGDTLLFRPNSTNIEYKEKEHSINDDIRIHGKVVTYIVNLD